MGVDSRYRMNIVPNLAIWLTIWHLFTIVKFLIIQGRNTLLFVSFHMFQEGSLLLSSDLQGALRLYYIRGCSILTSRLGVGSSHRDRPMVFVVLQRLLFVMSMFGNWL